MSLKTFQETIGAVPDGAFGPDTLRKGAAYLQLPPLRAAHFFAQCSHESGGFRVFQENLNYTAEGLQKIWPKLFSTEIAAKYAGNPIAIANRAYADRLGNGNEASGDGWRYRGRGAIQLTGRANYSQFASFEGDQDILYQPDLVATKYPFESAVFFFRNLWGICDKGVDDSTIAELTKRINGGTHGLDERIRLTKQYAALLGVT